MKFETKFNINECVWYMRSNKPTKVKISAIKIFHVGTNQDSISYNAEDVLNPRSWLDHENLQEADLFISKTALLGSLFTDVTTEYQGIN